MSTQNSSPSTNEYGRRGSNSTNVKPSAGGLYAALSGGLAGSVAKTFTAPLSRLTIIYQVDSALPASHRLTTKGARESMTVLVRHILNTEGMQAFWKGNLMSVLHRFPYSAIYFSSYEMCTTKLMKDNPESPSSRLFCGSIAGAAACASVYPLDLVRTRLTINRASQGKDRLSNDKHSIWQVFRTIIKVEGYRGLYRGLYVSLVVSVPQLAISYAVYGTGKEYILKPEVPNVYNILKKNENIGGVSSRVILSPLASMGLGAFSGIIVSAIVYPADVIRRRLQVRGMNTTKQYVDAVATLSTANSTQSILPKKISPSAILEIRDLFKMQGIRGFYMGIAPELLKVTPMVAITFTVYEWCKIYLTRPVT